jgi:hypothetical protein
MSKAIAVVGSMKRYIVTFLSLVVVMGIFSAAYAGDKYYTVKYQTPAGAAVEWGGFVFGAGINRDDGTFVGLDLNWSIDDLGYWGGKAFDEDEDKYDGGYGIYEGKCFFGGGVSLGKIYQFSDDIQFAYGGSAGYWYAGDFQDTYNDKSKNKEDLRYTYVATHSFLAPFVKARWRFLELSYKMHLGIATANVHLAGSADVKSKSECGIASHELAVGVYLARPKSGE